MKFSDYRRAATEGLTPSFDEASIPRRAQRFQGRPAGLLTRILAAVVDVILVYLVVTLMDISIRALDLVATPFVSVPIPNPAILVVAGFAIFWGYSTWAWGSLGRTLGDHVMGVRLVTQDGANPGMRRAALRSLAFIAFPPGLFLVPFSRRGRSLQDMLVATEVHYDWVTRVPPPP